MKNLQKVCVILCIMGLMISCGGSGSSGGGNTPEKVAEKYVETLYKGDLDAVMKYMSKAEQAEMKGAKKEELEMAKFFMKAIAEKNKGASCFKALEEETVLSEDGESATVKVEVTNGDNTSTEKVKLMKEDGKWVVKEMSLK